MSFTIKDLLQFGGLIASVIAAVWYLSRRLSEIENTLTKFIERLSAQDSRLLRLEQQVEAQVLRNEGRLEELSKAVQGNRERLVTLESKES